MQGLSLKENMYATTSNHINLNVSKQFYNSKPRANSAVRRNNHNTQLSLSLQNYNTAGGDFETNLPKVVGAYVSDDSSFVNNRAQSASSGVRRSVAANTPVAQYSTMFQNTIMNGSTQSNTTTATTTTSLPLDYDSFKAKIEKKNSFSNNTSISSSNNMNNKLVFIRPPSSSQGSSSNSSSAVVNVTQSTTTPLLRSTAQQVIGTTIISNISGGNPIPITIQSILKQNTVTNINKSNVNSNNKSLSFPKKKVCFSNPLTTSQPLANPFEFPKKQQQLPLHSNKSILNNDNIIEQQQQSVLSSSVPLELLTTSTSSSSSDLSPNNSGVLIHHSQYDNSNSNNNNTPSPSPPPISLLSLPHTTNPNPNNNSSPTTTILMTSSTQQGGGVKSGGGLFSTGSSVGIGWGSNNNTTTNNNSNINNSIVSISPIPINHNTSSTTSSPPLINTLHRKSLNNNNPFNTLLTDVNNKNHNISSTQSSPVKPTPLFTALPITALLSTEVVKEDEVENNFYQQQQHHLVVRPAATLAKPSKDFETLLKSMQIEDDCNSVNSSSTEIITVEEGEKIQSPRFITTKSDGITVQINHNNINSSNKKQSIASVGIADETSPFVPVKSAPLKPITASTTTITSTNNIIGDNTTSSKTAATTTEVVAVNSNNNININNLIKQQQIIPTSQSKKKSQRPSLTEQLAQIGAKASAITSDFRLRSNSQDNNTTGEISLFQSNLNNAITLGRNSNGIYMSNNNNNNLSNSSSSSDCKLVFTMPSKSFSIGSLTCKYPSPVLFYTDRFEYLFNHPYESTAINMVIYYRDMQGVSIVGTKFRFKLPRKLALFISDFDPQNPLHMIVLELSTSSRYIILLL